MTKRNRDHDATSDPHDEITGVLVELRTCLERIATGKRRTDRSRSYTDMSRAEMMTLAARVVAATASSVSPVVKSRLRNAGWVQDLRNHDKRARQIFDQVREGVTVAPNAITHLPNARTPYVDEGTIDSLHATHLKTIALLLARVDASQNDIRAVNAALSSERRKLRAVNAALSGAQPDEVRHLLESHDPGGVMRRVAEENATDRDRWRDRALLAERKAESLENRLTYIADATSSFATDRDRDYEDERTNHTDGRE